jgi:hypothetical protein
LVTDCDDAFMFEVTNDHEVVWSHDYGNSYTIARAQKYPLNYLDGGFPEFILGDVNFDGILDVLDLLYTSDMSSGYGYNPTPPADYNEDGSVTIIDVILLSQYIINN